jgi:hypothetical protein
MIRSISCFMWIGSSRTSYLMKERTRDDRND